jgi:hypothetical protein
MVAVEHDQPGAGPENRPPGACQIAERPGQPLALDPERDGGRLAAGHDERVEAEQVGRSAHQPCGGPLGGQHARVCLEVAL